MSLKCNNNFAGIKSGGSQSSDLHVSAVYLQHSGWGGESDTCYYIYPLQLNLCSELIRRQSVWHCRTDYGCWCWPTRVYAPHHLWFPIYKYRTHSSRAAMIFHYLLFFRLISLPESLWCYWMSCFGQPTVQKMFSLQWYITEKGSKSTIEKLIKVGILKKMTNNLLIIK